ncbi:MAG: MlaD family protein, partial [Longimicrobiales bacterium]
MLGLFAGAVLIFFLDDLLNAFKRDYEIHVVLPGATGLTADSPVWVSGREIGSVTMVGFLPAGKDSLARVVLRLRLPLSVQSQVRADSEVRLTSVSMMSARAVDILPGTAGARALAPGDTLRLTPHLTPMQLSERAAIVQKNLSAALAELREQAPAIRARLLQTRSAFAGLMAVMDEARTLQVDLDATPGFAVLQDPAFAASLQRTRSHVAELTVLIGRLRDSTGPPAEVRAAIARLQARADSLT